MSLSERAILAHLTISVWSGTVGRNPDDTNNLDPERDRIIHSVVPPSSLNALKVFARRIRTEHYRYSSPWDDNGLRLIPSQNLFDYSAKMRELRDTYTSMVQEQLPNITGLIESKYLEQVGDLPSRFGTQLTFYPVPDGGKLPLIVDTVTASVRDSIVQSMNADTQVRTAQIIETLRHTLIVVCKRLSSSDSMKEDKRTDLHANGEMLCKTLEALDNNQPHFLLMFNRQHYRDVLHSLGV